MKRVLIHGFGSIGQRHLRVVSELDPNLEVAVLSEHGSHARAANAPGRLFKELEQARAFQPDAVVVANAAVAHVAAASGWLQAGTHVLVEKPLAPSTEHLDELLVLARSSGRVLQVGYNLRQAPGLRLMREWCEQGRLGRILSARLEVGQNLAGWRAGTDLRTSVSAQRAMGGGVLLELSHEIDYLQWLLGPVDWVSAQLFRLGSWDIDVEDTAFLTLGMTRPGHGVASLQMDFVRHDSTRQCTLVGELGSLRWNAMAGTLQVHHAGAEGWSTLQHIPPERDATYRAQWQAFAAACSGLSLVPADAEDGARVVRVVEAARRSAELSGQRVSLKRPE
jgi:predicted dehydrogenase